MTIFDDARSSAREQFGKYFHLARVLARSELPNLYLSHASKTLAVLTLRESKLSRQRDSSLILRERKPLTLWIKREVGSLFRLRERKRPDSN